MTQTNDNMTQTNDNMTQTNDKNDNDNTKNDSDKQDKYSDRQMWRTVKDITNNKKQKLPRLIMINNKLTTSLKKIYNHANKFLLIKYKY